MVARTLQDILPSFLVGPGGERMTPDQIRQRQLIAASLRQQATDTSPNAGGWASVLSKGIMGLSAGLQEGRADRAAQGAADDSRYNLSSLLTGLTSDTPVPSAGVSSTGVPVASVPSPGASGDLAASSPTPAAPIVASGEIPDYIRQAATARGIDPEVALRVAHSEGGFSNPVIQSVGYQNGVREQSYGPFQLNMRAGLGAKALEAGIDPRDPNQWKRGVDFALDQARAGGWGPWMGAKKIGVTGMTGIGQAPVQVASSGDAANIISGAVPVPLARPEIASIVPVERAPLQPVAEAAPLRDYSQMPEVIPSSDVNAPVNGGVPSAAVANALAGAVKGGRLGAPQPLSDSSFNDRFGGQPAISPQSIAQAAQPQPVPPQGAGPQMQNAAFMPEIAGQSGAGEQATPSVASQLAASSPQPAAPVAPQQVAQNAPVQRQPLNIPQAVMPTVHPLSPAVIKTLSNPYASPEEQRVAGMLLQRYQGEKDAYQKAALADQANRQAIQQRVGIADQLGIDRNLVLDEDAWKKAVEGSVAGSTPLAQVQLEKARQDVEAGKDRTPESVRALNARADAAGLAPGSKARSDFMLSGGQRTPQTVAPPAQDYRYVYDDNGNVSSVEIIPGSPTALKMEKANEKDAATAEGQATATDVVTNAAQRARQAYNSGGILSPVTGRLGEAVAFADPTSNAAELRRQIDAVKATATIESLNAMRAASPTGGALGNVTEGEGRMLAAKAGSLDPNSKDFTQQLDDYERTLYRVIYHSREQGDSIFDSTRQKAPGGSDNSHIDSLVKKYGG